MRMELTRERLLSLMKELARTAPRRGSGRVFLVGGGAAGSQDRHLFIDTIGPIAFYHFDPYAQLLSKVVRGFQRDLEDAREFVSSGMVDPARLLALVGAIPDATYARYPSLSRAAVEKAV